MNAKVFWGKKEAIAAEISSEYADSVYTKWLVVGETADGTPMTPECCYSKKEAKEVARECAAYLGTKASFIA